MKNGRENFGVKQMALPPNMSNFHDVFYVSQLRRYIVDSSHVIPMDDVQVRDDITIETVPVRIEDYEIKKFRGKAISLVKVVWGGSARENVMWKLESKIREAYPKLFT